MIIVSNLKYFLLFQLFRKQSNFRQTLCITIFSSYSLIAIWHLIYRCFTPWMCQTTELWKKWEKLFLVVWKTVFLLYFLVCSLILFEGTETERFVLLTNVKGRQEKENPSSLSRSSETQTFRKALSMTCLRCLTDSCVNNFSQGCYLLYLATGNIRHVFPLFIHPGLSFR